MKSNNKELIIDYMIDKIDWNKIKSYHKKLNIKWEFSNGDEKIPDILDLKSGFKEILYQMIEQDLKLIALENWLIYWDRTNGLDADLKIIFKLFDIEFLNTKSTDELDNLSDLLNKAVESEDYEKAALLRDKIKKELNKR